jgi:opacity protein-like surface antigen
MTARKRTVKRSLGIGLSLLLILGAADMFGRERGAGTPLQRFSISLGGGYGFAEGHHGMADLQAEFQFSFTPHIRLGLGFGYLTNGEGHSRHDDMGDPRSRMMDSRLGLDGWLDWGDTMQEPRPNYRIVPLTLNLYGAFPLGRRWTLFMSGGGSFNFGSFRDAGETQTKNAWGGQAGLGAEFRLTRNISLVAEGGYRLLGFKRLTRPRFQSPLNFLEQLLSVYLPGQPKNIAERWLANIFESLTGWEGRMGPSDNFYSLHLNGFSLRAALKFSM